VSMTHASDRFTVLPDDQTLAATVVALEEHGFSVEVVGGLDAAREAVLARIPAGSSVMTNTSVTLAETGIADVINDGGAYESARNKMFALDFETQAQEMKVIGGQPDYALGSVHAVTRDGTLVIASASGSQLASYAWGAANVIFVVGAQKLVPALEAARERIYQHSLNLRTPAHRPPTGSTVRSGRSSRSTRSSRAASTSSSSGIRSASDRPGPAGSVGREGNERRPALCRDTRPLAGSTPSAMG
jgi:acyl-CoA hydrolase